jgi:putative inorganic carbon (HCO3(-)) transporter
MTGERGTRAMMWFVLAYVALMQVQLTFEPGTTGFRIAPADLCLLLALAVAPGQLRYRRPAWTIWHTALVFVFLIGTLVEAFNEGVLSRYVVLNKDIGLGFLFLSYAAITSVATDWHQIRRIVSTFTISVAVMNVIAVGAYLVAYRLHTDNLFTAYGGSRLAGLVVDPNAYGGLLATALALAEGASWGTHPLFRPWMRVFLRTSLGLGLLFTFSRSAWIALALALALLCTVRRGMALKFALGGAAGIVAVFLVMGPRFLDFFKNMASRPEQVEGRFELLHDAWTQFSTYPWIGGGLSSFFMKEGTMVHNTAFWFLADFGIVGLLIFIGFVAWFFRAAWTAFILAPRPERPVALATAMAHLALVGLMMGIEGFYQRHWWMILALISSAYMNTRKARAHGETEAAHHFGYLGPGGAQ